MNMILPIKVYIVYIVNLKKKFFFLVFYNVKTLTWGNWI